MTVIVEWERTNPKYGWSVAFARSLDPTPGRPPHPSIDQQWEAELSQWRAPPAYGIAGDWNPLEFSASIRSPDLRPRPAWVDAMHDSVRRFLTIPIPTRSVREDRRPETPFIMGRRRGT